MEFVILPLYSSRKIEKFVPAKSGLNQWNTGGRKRDFGEMYIPVPSLIHKKFPTFFPPRDKNFIIKTPLGEILNAKICQDNSKALMSNPNKALSNWLLRDVLGLKNGEILSYDRLQILDFDSVIIRKISDDNYEIDKAKFGDFERFKDSLDI